MKRTFQLTLFAIVFILSACLSACQSNATPAPTAVPTMGPTPTSAPTKAPTAMPPTKVPEVTPTTKPSFLDKFDSADNWLQPLTVTSQALKGKEQTVVEVKDGVMGFLIKDEETYVYAFNKNAQKSDVAAEVKFQNVGRTDMDMVLVCRAKADYSSWYEVRLSLTGLYKFMKFDAKLRDLGQNPYKTIKTGTAPKDTILPLKSNTFKLACKGQDLTLDLNASKFTVTVQDPDFNYEGLVGLGMISNTVLPIEVKYDDFSITAP